MAKQSPLSLDAAKNLLEPDLYQLCQRLGKMSEVDAKKLAPIMLEALKLPNPYLAHRAMEDLLQARPEWVDLPVWKEGKTVLMEAAKTGNLDLVDILVAQGANVRKKSKKGESALTLALKYDANHRFQEAVVDAILDAAKFTASDKSFALALAANEGNLGGVRSLLKHKANFTEELYASYSEEVEATNHGNALQVACFKPEDDGQGKDIVTALLENPASKAVIDYGWDNDDYGAPLNNAAFNNNTHAIALLLKNGAQVNPPDYIDGENPKTPLMSAAEGMHIEAMRLLLNAGAKANLVDDLGQNALHYLASGESYMTEEEELEYNLPCFHALLKAGADPGLVNDDGETPADLARQAERNVLASHLEQIALGNQVSAPQSNKTGPRL